MSEQTIKALKSAYRKHHLMDDSIGWEELGEILCDALCEEIGDVKFCEFVKRHQKEGEIEGSECKEITVENECDHCQKQEDCFDPWGS